jgi:hypothetical protein
MKNLIYALVLASGLISSCQTAGVFLGEGENNGKKFSIGSDKSVDVVLDIAKQYSAQQPELMMANYSEEFAERASGWTANWLGSMESITMDPYMIVPVKMEGSDNTMVLTWSVEDRHSKNGSKEKLNLMEIFTLDQDQKVTAFAQWSNVMPESQFGKRSGGKFLGRGESEYSGRALVFSDRGEVEAIEQLVKDYNNRDGAACNAAFAEGAVFNTADGNQMVLSEDVWAPLFDSYEELKWEIYSITPVKIQNTDPESGVTVYGREKRVFKDGTVWEKELVEWFYFNLDGKISRVNQYTRDLVKK